MNLFRCSLLSLLVGLVVGGCTSDDVAEASPTMRLFRGEIAADEYADEITAANIQTQQAAQFEVNREPTRAYNTKSGNYEYVPEDTQQRWNEEDQRWEFTPVGGD